MLAFVVIWIAICRVLPFVLTDADCLGRFPWALCHEVCPVAVASAEAVCCCSCGCGGFVLFAPIRVIL